MTWKSYALVSGAGLLATYLASPPLLPQNDTPAAPAASGDAASDPAVDIEEEAARLHARLRAEAVFRAPARDPFRFGERPVRRTPPRAEVAAQAGEPPPAVPEPPFLVLSGIATDIVDGEPHHTAVLTTASDVLLVRAGEKVGSEYTVRAITADRIDLESTVDGTIRQLHLPVPVPVP